jgi:hypothetical protein
LLGGSGTAGADAVAVDNAGEAFVGGTTTNGATAFPTTAGAYQRTFAGTGDGFVTKFAAGGGSLAYSTLLGGSGTSTVTAIALDAGLGARVAGTTTGSTFPTTTGAVQTTFSGTQDAFASALNATGTALPYSTFLGGTGSASATGAGVAPDGSTWVSGTVTGGGFPTQLPTQSSNAGGTDAFLSHLASNYGSLLFSTYAGGSGNDTGAGVAVDAGGDAFLAGATNSASFPVAHSATYEDAYVQEYGATPPPPVITGIGSPTGSSNYLTSNPNQSIVGTASPGATVTLSAQGVGVVGSTTANGTTGAWTYNYAATTLPAGSTAFTATETVSGVLSAASAAFFVVYTTTNPTVKLTPVGQPDTSLAPEFEATVSDPYGVPDGTP